MNEEPLDVSDKIQVRKALKKAERDLMLADETLRNFLSTPLGRKYFHDLLLACHCFSNSFSSDPLLMAFSCGEQNIGLRILADLNRACPELYLQMMKESTDANLVQ